MRNINFTGMFSKSTLVSIALVVGAAVILITKGLNYGVDFRGGAEIQVRFTESIELQGIRDSLNKGGFKASSVQQIGDNANNEFMIKLQASEENINEVTEKVTATLKSDFATSGFEIRKTDIVGPKAGEQLRISGFQAMLYALIGIMIYIGLRFDFKYSPGAIAALFHDVLIILGIFAIMNLEFSLQIVGALLAVIGYSVNDTVVVYDRVREHEEKGTSPELRNNINIALNETLTRTILTSLTTLMVSAIMFIWGGGIIKDFFLAISLGVIIGTYSSIFVAAPVTLLFDKLQGQS